MLLHVKINPMNPQLILALLQHTTEFLAEIPDSHLTHQQISLHSRISVYHTFSIFLREYQHHISYSETREVTEAYINLIKCIHRKYNTEQVGSYMTHPR
jgi:hypothetical protein